jgi:iron complex outermembrane receptor protein
VRGQIRHSEGPLDVNLMFDAQDMNLPTFANQWVMPAGKVAYLPLGYTGPRYDIGSDVKNGLHQVEQRGMLTANYQLGWATLTSTSMISFSRSMQDFAAAVDLATEASFQASGWAGLYPLGGTSTNAKDQTLYQDFHLTGDFHDGALQWLTGVEFLAQDDTYVRDVGPPRAW